MSWSCEHCGDSHPGRFRFCPKSGRARGTRTILTIDLCRSRTGILEVHGRNRSTSSVELSTGVEKLGDGLVELTIRVPLRGHIEPDPESHYKVVVLPEETADDKDPVGH